MLVKVRSRGLDRNGRDSAGTSIHSFQEKAHKKKGTAWSPLLVISLSPAPLILPLP